MHRTVRKQGPEDTIDLIKNAEPKDPPYHKSKGNGDASDSWDELTFGFAVALFRTGFGCESAQARAKQGPGGQRSRDAC